MGVLLREAPDLAARGDRRLVVEVHLGGEIAGLTLVGTGDDEAALGIIAEARAVRHADELVVDETFRHRLQRLGHRLADRFLVALVADGEELAIDKAVRPVRVAWAHRRYRRQAEDLFALHSMYPLKVRRDMEFSESLGVFGRKAPVHRAVQPPSMA